jgi:Ni/Co efflux regulator RcnB
MKRTLLTLAAVAALAGAIPAVADAAPWQSINQREANLNQRIDQGIRNGSLTRPEAVRLRTDLRRLERLEAQYRRSRPGLTMSERLDLDRRFEALNARVFEQKHDRQHR